MNISHLAQQWYPLFLEKQLGAKPVAVSLLGKSLVLVRLEGQVLCFENRCPHRHVPLSIGKVIEGTLQCAYHGWRFNAQGTSSCHAQAQLVKYGVVCKHGVIWVRLSGTTPFTDFFAVDDTFATQFSVKLLSADYIHTIENFLDPLHTPYVHSGLLRGSGLQRMQVSQQSDSTSFTTYYQLLDKQNGWINRLFDRGIDTQVASFYYPGFACIRYFKKSKAVFQVSIFFVPTQPGQVKMVVGVSLPKTIIPTGLKFILLRPFLELVFKQDQKILEQQYLNQQVFGADYMVTNTDLVIDHLLFLLKNGPKGVDKELLLTL